MASITLFLLPMVCFLFHVNCSQNLYKLVPDHCEAVCHNKSFFQTFNYKCVKRSRTLLLFNINATMNVDIFSDKVAQALITGYQFRRNEYRKCPIEFMMGFCSIFASKDFDIPNMLANSNARCPFRKGQFYYIYGLKPNATNMPPFIPAGKWEIEVKFIYGNRYPMFSAKWFTDIVYDPVHEIRSLPVF